MRRDERVRIGFLIHDVSRLRRTAFDHRLKPFEVTRSQWWVLAGISRHGSFGIIQSELARLLDIGKVALGGLIDRLEDRGLVERKADANDRRINRIVLTPKGNQVLERMTQIGVDMNAQVMQGIALHRLHVLADGLHRMKENLIAMKAVPGSKPKTPLRD